MAEACRRCPGCGWWPLAGAGLWIRMEAAGRPRQRGGRLRLDLVQLALAFDLDLPRLCLLGNRDPQCQDAKVVVGLDVLRVQGVAENELAAEDAAWPLGDHQFNVGLGGL